MEDDIEKAGRSLKEEEMPISIALFNTDLVTELLVVATKPIEMTTRSLFSISLSYSLSQPLSHSIFIRELGNVVKTWPTACAEKRRESKRKRKNER